MRRICIGVFCLDPIVEDVWKAAPSREVAVSALDQLRIRGDESETLLRELFECSLKRNLSVLSCTETDFEWYHVADTLSTDKAVERSSEVYRLLKGGELPVPGKNCQAPDPSTQTRLRSCPLWAGYGSTIPSLEDVDWQTMAERWSGREEYDYATAAFLRAIDERGRSAVIDLHLASISGIWGQTEIALGLYGRVIATTESTLLSIAARLNAVLTLSPIVPEDPESEQARLEHDLQSFQFDSEKPIDATLLLRHVGRTLFHAAHRCSRHELKIQQNLASLLRRMAPSLAPIPPPPAVRRRRLYPRNTTKVAFVSAYLSEHSIGKMLAELIAKLSQQFFIYIFHLDQHSDHVTTFIDANAAHSQVLDRHLSLDAARAQIVAAEIDILIYPDLGMEAWSFFLAFSRLAPIQCVWWGHPVTTGLTSIDYFFSLDSEVTEAQSLLYSEQLIRLHHVNTAPFVQVDLQADTHKINRTLLLSGLAHLESPDNATSAAVYLVLGRLFKLHPVFDDILLRILDRDKTGILVLIIEPQRFVLHDLWLRLRRRALAFLGDDSVLRRIRFLHYWKYVEVLSVATVVLDTYPYGGCLTALDAMSNGVPLVTLPSSFERGRFAASIYTQMNYTELIAPDADTFVTLVTRLGSDREFRDRAAKSLREAYPRAHRTAAVAQEWTELFRRILI